MIYNFLGTKINVAHIFTIKSTGGRHVNREIEIVSVGGAKVTVYPTAADGEYIPGQRMYSEAFDKRIDEEVGKLEQIWEHTINTI